MRSEKRSVTLAEGGRVGFYVSTVFALVQAVVRGAQGSLSPHKCETVWKPSDKVPDGRSLWLRSGQSSHGSCHDPVAEAGLLRNFADAEPLLSSAILPACTTTRRRPSWRPSARAPQAGVDAFRDADTFRFRDSAGNRFNPKTRIVASHALGPAADLLYAVSSSLTASW
jgi:hypothetical protein